MKPGEDLLKNPSDYELAADLINNKSDQSEVKSKICSMLKNGEADFTKFKMNVLSSEAEALIDKHLGITTSVIESNKSDASEITRLVDEILTLFNKSSLGLSDHNTIIKNCNSIKVIVSRIE